MHSLSCDPTDPLTLQNNVFSSLCCHQSYWFCYRCRHHILNPLQLGPLFPKDGSTLRPNVGSGLNQMKIDLRNVFVENITYFWKNKTIFGKEMLQEILECAYAYRISVRTLKPCVCIAYCFVLYISCILFAHL